MLFQSRFNYMWEFDKINEKGFKWMGGYQAVGGCAETEKGPTAAQGVGHDLLIPQILTRSCNSACTQGA